MRLPFRGSRLRATMPGVIAAVLGGIVCLLYGWAGSVCLWTAHPTAGASVGVGVVAYCLVVIPWLWLHGAGDFE